jgi:sugar lactone lactonase YvrE
MISLTIARQTTFVAAFTMALGCGYDSTTPYPSPTPNPSVVEGLWTASGSNPAILRLAPNQLLVTGDRVPATKISTPSADLFDLNGIAFDTDGTMWVSSQNDARIVAFGPAALASSGATAATKVIAPPAGSLSGPTSLAFDPQHRLWVANFGSGTIVRFDRAQLASSGSPVPSVTISGLGHPTALAFDADGSLWVSDSQAHTVAKFAAAQLAASGSPAAAVVISSANNSIMNPAGIAFDAAGNLWIGNLGDQSLASFSPAQLATTGSPAPRVVISTTAGSLLIPAGLAFDDGGNLWVIGGAGTLDKFASAALGATGAPAPTVRVAVTGHALFWSVAFWPQPEPLPLN